MADHVVQEVDGSSRFLLEDGSGSILLELQGAAGGPTVPPLWPNPDSPAGRRRGLLGSVSSIAVNLLGRDTFFGGPGRPLSNYDWPNPRGRAFPIDLRTHLAEAQLAPPPNPFFQDDWPNPARARRAVDLLTAFGEPPPPAAPVAEPFKPLEQPNPQRRTIATALLTQTEGPPFGEGGEKPFAQEDWPNPRGPGRALDTRGAAGRNPSDLASPFFQDDWPNPRRPAFPLELRTMLGRNPPEGAIVTPFVPIDLPQPVRALRRDPLGFVGSVNLGLLGQDQFFGAPGQPPAARAPDNPRGPTWPIDLRTLLGELPPVAAPIVLPPGASLSFEPRARGLRVELRSLTLGPIPTTLVAPFVIEEWPAPRGRVWRLELRTILGRLPPGTGLLDPFTPREWPNPLGLQARRRSLFDTAAAIQLALTTPFTDPFGDVTGSAVVLAAMRGSAREFGLRGSGVQASMSGAVGSSAMRGTAVGAGEMEGSEEP